MESRIRGTHLRQGLAFMLLMPAAIALAGPATLPSVTVSGVTATSPVLRNSGAIDVNATVTPVFDSGSVTSSTVNNSCRWNGNYCGTGNAAVTDQTVVTTTTVSVGDMQTTASAADSFNGSGTQVLSGTAFATTLAVPNTTTDGRNSVTVSASVSESLTTVVTTVTTNYSCTKSAGTTTCNVVGIPATTTSAPSTVYKSASASGTGSYILDVNPPALELHPVVSQPEVQQGTHKNIHNVLIGGSELKPYSVTDTIVGPDGFQNSATGTGTFGQSPKNDGNASDKHDLIGVYVACDAPLGTYTATATASTVDLGDNPFDTVNSTNSDTFTVTPGVALSDQTQVVSELPPSGDYAPMSCFKAGTSGRKISTFPGSLHLTATIDTTGACAGFATLSGTVVTLTLPAGFSFADSGASPKAHVFVGPAVTGFDFHYPQTLAEVTSLIPKPSVSGQTVTVDLSKLTMGLDPGVIPANNVIYVRAHAAYSGSGVPADGTPFDFSTTATSTLPGIGPTIASSSQRIFSYSGCVNGE